VVGLTRAVGLALVLGLVVDVLARVVGDVSHPVLPDYAETGTRRHVDAPRPRLLVGLLGEPDRLLVGLGAVAAAAKQKG
jgi:hypothetical protein